MILLGKLTLSGGSAVHAAKVEQLFPPEAHATCAYSCHLHPLRHSIPFSLLLFALQKSSHELSPFQEDSPIALRRSARNHPESLDSLYSARSPFQDAITVSRSLHASFNYETPYAPPTSSK